MNKTFTTRALTFAALLALPLSLTACATEAEDTEKAPAASQQDVAKTESGIEFVEPWAKAADGMSGVFGTLKNTSDEEVTLVSASSPRADLVELHETTMVDGKMIMREIDGGFVIPAGESYVLEPGEHHIMLMELDSELLPGEVLPLTLEFSNGETMTLDLDVREFAGADEDYGDLEHGDHDEHADQGDHGDHSDQEGHEGHSEESHD
ncbi:copper chaperone PCu(A)C [Leucobacter sp. UCMA 4100]|uniref:copper chaperone PCu(A)C n=1 Tax=Leucobacter sp. UCMA 4100 TaxID=2810534 RepID=UPI0022EA8984|nr:copper chaperone PCu(A)C [Leucobacter sp. UCMA 4100]MDA3147931.1 copper chaperone PCu(A)C [Leucobacter sp. UCMA 4100]